MLQSGVKCLTYGIVFGTSIYGIGTLIKDSTIDGWFTMQGISILQRCQYTHPDFCTILRMNWNNVNFGKVDDSMNQYHQQQLSKLNTFFAINYDKLIKDGINISPKEFKEKHGIDSPDIMINVCEQMGIKYQDWTDDNELINLSKIK